MVTADFARLASRLHGSVMSPRDPRYASLCKWFIGRADESCPQAVVRCADTHDVVEALRFIRSSRLPFAVRSGGHSYAEFSSTNGLLIDLGPMDGIEMHGTAVQVGPGIRVGPLSVALSKHERVVPLGWCSTVGVAGSVLGGGFGPLGRFYGLSCDHLEAAQVVLADGRVLWVDSGREPDLFWALRGAGGGNFGVVTSLVLRTRPAVPLASFTCSWRLEHAVPVVDMWQRWAPDAPDEVNAELVVRAPQGRSRVQVVMFGVMVGADQSHARSAIKEMEHRVGIPAEHVEIIELPAAEAAWRRIFAGEEIDADLAFGGRPAGRRPGLRLVKSDFFEQGLPETAIAELVDLCATGRSAAEYRTLEFVAWGGALSRESPTAFVHRSPRFLLQQDVQSWGPPEDRLASRRWVNASWGSMHRWATGHVYQNFPDPELTGWAHAYYGANLERLQRIKAAYDPGNLFAFAQSIPLP